MTKDCIEGADLLQWGKCLFGWWFSMRYTFAPLEGVTGYVYRNLHRRWFGGVERYYMPFIPVGQSRSFSSREWQDICPEHNESSDLVPQLLGKDAEGFLWAARELRALGYREINFNLGCPSGTVTAKGKGAGFLILSLIHI